MVTRTVVLSPPAEMMRDCERPDVDLSTNSAITDSLLSCHARIVECNVERQSARQYVDDARARIGK